MIVGFTGTRNGMTEYQIRTVLKLLHELKPTEAHHGDCVGSDDEFATMCSGLEPRPLIVAHPGKSVNGPEEHELRAHNKHNDLIKSTKGHFERNRNIVSLVEVVIATPKEDTPQQQGGTWYTIDQARKSGKVTHVVTPDGTILI